MEVANKISLFDIVTYVESHGNPHSIRFEPGVYHSIAVQTTTAQKVILTEIVRIHDCSMGTAQMIYSTSWGAAQIMGFNLFGSLGYKSPVWSFGDDEIAQVAMFELFCKQKEIEFTVEQLLNPADRNLFARKYNGDTDAYSAMLKMSLHHYGLI